MTFKFYILLILFSLGSLLMFGADITHAALKATIKKRDGTVVTGYFVCNNLSITKDSAGYFYQDGPITMRLKGTYQDGGLLIDTLDYHLVNEVKRKLPDSVDVFTDALFFGDDTEPGHLMMPWFIGKSVKINSTQIASITIHIAYNFYYGPTLLTQLSATDKTWITNQYQICKGIADEQLCSYNAIYFSGTAQRTLKNVTKLKALFDALNAKPYDGSQEELKLRQAIDEEVERLRMLKIIIYGYCSC